MKHQYDIQEIAQLIEKFMAGTTSIAEEDVLAQYFRTHEVSEEWTKGDKVRVTGGLFEGAEGYIKRIKGNHRLVVAIEGITAVATSYIPTCYLERIE